MKMTYDKATEISKKYGEANDCVVKAVAIACRMSYEKAYEICASVGRRPRKGVVTSRVVSVLNECGYTVEPINTIQPNGSFYTPVTIGNKLNKGYYIVRSKGHAMAVVNGKVEDWASTKRKRIVEGWKITKKHK